MWCVRVFSVARSCATKDDNNKDNVCTPNIPGGIKCPPPSKTISLITRFGAISTESIDAIADSGRKERSLYLVNNNQIYPEMWRMGELTRDGTAEPVSRDQIVRHERGHGNIHFPCLADLEQNWQSYPVNSDEYRAESARDTVHIIARVYY